MKVSKRAGVIGLAVVLLVGGVIAWLALSGGRSDYVQIVNGFEFAVKVKFTHESGDEQTFDVPAKGRVPADLAGKYAAEFFSPTGKSMKKRDYKFSDRDARKARCFEFVNVLGSAAILEENIVYGMGIKGTGTLTSGKHQAKLCPRWGFERDAPPKAIKVKQYTGGRRLSWMHYVGEGDWHTSVDLLLKQKPEVGDQSRIKAWNIVNAVMQHDPQNARLAALAPRLKAACNTIVDFVKTGPLAGKKRKKCLRQTARLFASK